MAPDLSILNPHPRRIPGPSLLHHLVATDGDQNVAIDYLSPGGTREQVSYEEFHRRADCLATRLRSIRDERLFAPGTNFIVPLFIAQSPDLYVAQLATLKAGAAFCPISLDVPEERLRFILQDVDAGFLLTTTDLRGSLPEIDGLFILSADEATDNSMEGPLNTEVEASSPAYIMYTSGSTVSQIGGSRGREAPRMIHVALLGHMPYSLHSLRHLLTPLPIAIGPAQGSGALPFCGSPGPPCTRPTHTSFLTVSSVRQSDLRCFGVRDLLSILPRRYAHMWRAPPAIERSTRVHQPDGCRCSRAYAIRCQ